LIKRHTKFQGLTVTTIKPGALSFGVSSFLEDVKPNFEVEMFQPYILEGVTPWRGEVVIFAEHGGVWHAIAYTQTERIIQVNGNAFVFPPKIGGRKITLSEKSNSGYYRYFAIGQSGKFSDAIREHFHFANPFTQPTLDLMGDLLNSQPEKNVMVSGITLSVKSEK